MPTKIEWCEESWNPVVGCRKVSAGCTNCYAERMAARQAAMGNADYKRVVTNGQWNGKAYYRDDVRMKPYEWRKPRLVFLGSMGDTFLEPGMGYHGKIFKSVAQNPQHRFVVLTKRPENMNLSLAWWLGEGEYYNNLWLGVSIEDKETLAERVRKLVEIPAAKRVISYEPALERISHPTWGRVLSGGQIHWVICGCESGPGPRPFDEDWARTTRDACQACDVPFFYKQGLPYKRAGQPTKMPTLDGRVWAQRPN